MISIAGFVRYATRSTTLGSVSLSVLIGAKDSMASNAAPAGPPPGGRLLPTLFSKRRQVLLTSFTLGPSDRLLVGIKRAIVIGRHSVEDAPILDAGIPKKSAVARFSQSFRTSRMKFRAHTYSERNCWRMPFLTRCRTADIQPAFHRRSRHRYP